MEKQFYAYLHCYPDTKIPFWVGKGYGTRTNSVRKRNKQHLHYIEKCGGIKKVHIIKYLVDSEYEAFRLEEELIYILRELLGIKLANWTNGGEGPAGYKHTQEAKEKQRDALFGKKRPNSVREKISKSKIGKKGPKASLETRQKMRLAKLGKKHSKESIEKMSLAKRGWKPSKETIEKNRLAHLGKSPSQETRERLRIANTGKKRSIEIRKKFSLRQKRVETKKRFARMIEKNLKDIPYIPRDLYAKVA